MLAQKDEEKFIQFFAEEQKRADAAGMNIVEYMAQANGGILKDTVAKMLRHAKAHPKSCPPDCAFQRSFDRLKEKYGVK